MCTASILRVWDEWEETTGAKGRAVVGRDAIFYFTLGREALTPASTTLIGGTNKVVEADESFIGGKAKNRAYAKKEPKKHTVLTLVERDGKSRSFHIANVKAKTLREKY